MQKIGRFRNQIVLEIHSWQAEQLIKGKRVKSDSKAKQHAVVGLRAFSYMVTRIYRRFKAGDPYAEVALNEVEKRILVARDLLARLHAKLDHKLFDNSTLPGIQVQLCESERPLQISLRFSAPHANYGARLVGSYDLLIRKIETCKLLGVINSLESGRCLYNSRRVIRGVFATAAQYKDIDVAREDIIQNTTKGKVALDTLTSHKENSI